MHLINIYTFLSEILHSFTYFCSILKAKLFNNQGRSVCPEQLALSLIQTYQNCPIDFNLCMMIPIPVRYDLGTLHSLPESPYVHKNNSIFLVCFMTISLGRVVVLSPKIVISHPRTYEKLTCKGELFRLSGLQHPLVQTDILLLYYKDY